MAQQSLLVAYMFILFISPVCADESVYDLMSDNVTWTTAPQTYVNHPFETEMPANTKNVSRRLLSPKWEPLRIRVDTSNLDSHSFGAKATKLLHRITSSILPQAIKVLTNHLHVVRVNGNLIVTPGSCYYTRVPSSHNNEGVPDTDFILYITAQEKTNKQNLRALANGASCRVDQHGRPVAGMIHLFLALLGTENAAGTLPTNYLITLLAHEISHTLGWEYRHFLKFRDEHGRIRTDPILAKKSPKNLLGKHVVILRTPAITKYVREYFGCDELDGLELEDQGGPASKLSHPEKRIYPESYMAPSLELKSNYAIDALTLTVFQDSGWYQVKNLDQAGRLSFGRGMGCRVPRLKCNNWGAKASKKGMFCWKQLTGTRDELDLCVGHSKQALGFCNMMKHAQPVPSEFHYFEDPTFAGSYRDPDYCPRATERRFSDCTDLNNVGESFIGNSRAGAKVSAESRCFVSSLSKATKSSDVATCYQRTCKAHALEIRVGDHTVSCPRKKHATTVTVEGYHGHIVCPPYVGLEDARCRPTCSNNDPECLGIKGSVVDEPKPHSKRKKKTDHDNDNNKLRDLFNANNHDKPVVVHGRLRRG